MRANSMGIETGASGRPELEGKYLTFWTDQQLYGLPIGDVVQIVGVQEITILPQAPQYVKGIINLRGNIIPVMDARVRLGRPEKTYDERTCTIVTSSHKMPLGFVVDAVNEVTDIAADQISKPPRFNEDFSSNFLTGIARKEEHVILLIDTPKLLAESSIEMIIKETTI